MDLLVAWPLSLAVLAALCTGCGLLVDRVCGTRLPWALIAVGGYCAIVVGGQFTTLVDSTASLTTPLVVVAAIAGLALGARRRPELEPWALVAAVGVLAVYAAPIVLSGEPTIAGFIKLDDTATWLTLTDRVMDHGRDLSGLAPSSYEATLHFNLGEGYPVGVVHPVRRRRRDRSGRRGVGDPALHRVLRGAPRAGPVGAGDPARRPPAAARCGGVHRGPAGVAVRLLPVGRDQGGCGGGRDRGRGRLLARTSSRSPAQPPRLAWCRDRGGRAAGLLSAGGLAWLAAPLCWPAEGSSCCGWGGRGRRYAPARWSPGSRR